MPLSVDLVEEDISVGLNIDKKMTLERHKYRYYLPIELFIIHLTCLLPNIILLLND